MLDLVAIRGVINPGILLVYVGSVIRFRARYNYLGVGTTAWARNQRNPGVF